MSVLGIFFKIHIFLLCMFLSQHDFKDRKALKKVVDSKPAMHIHVLPIIISASYISSFSQVSFLTGSLEGFHICAGRWLFLPLFWLKVRDSIWRICNEKTFEESTLESLAAPTCSPASCWQLVLKSWAASCVRQLRGKAGSTARARRQKQFWKH